jgi:poly(A) polymerase Pap1
MYYIFANQKLECVQVFVCILHIHVKERDTKTVCVRLRKPSSQFARDLTDKDLLHSINEILLCI